MTYTTWRRSCCGWGCWMSRAFFHPSFFEVSVEGAAKVRGVILADQVKSLDWQVRRAEKKGKVAKSVLEEVVGKVRAILEG